MREKNNFRKWFDKQFHNIPDKYQLDFLRKTGLENLSRLRLISVFYLLLILGLTIIHINDSQAFYMNKMNQNLILDVILIIPSFLILLISYIHNPKTNTEVLQFHKVLSFFGAVFILSGSAAITVLLRNSSAGFYYAIAIFGISLLFYFRIFELSLIYIISILSVLLSGLYFEINAATILSEYKHILFFMPVGMISSRIFYSARLRNYINWRNLNDINKKMKLEITEKQQASDELNKAKKELEFRVDQRTQELKAANIQLKEEISQREYTDKIKSVLYNISNFINQTKNMDKLYSIIHNELRAVMDVKYFFIVKQNSEEQPSSIVFQINDREEYAIIEMAEAFTEHIIKKEEALLLRTDKMSDILGGRQFENKYIKASTWLGVPLFIRGRVIGAVTIKTCDNSKKYNKVDKEILEFVAEHIATAIDIKDTEHRLITAKEKAEESEKLKTSFLANMSHEIRTPMNAIVGFSDLLTSTDLTSDEKINYTHYVKKSSRNLLKIIEDMIIISRLESKQVKPVAKEFILNNLIMDLQTKCENIIQNEKKEDVKIKCNIPVGYDIIMNSDEARIKQIFDQLLNNAIKFTDTGYVEYGCRKSTPNQIEFYVKDTGIGFDEGQGELVFDIFRQIDESSTRQYGGTGLGLSITKELVTLLGGEISFKSDIGIGTIFTFSLPINLQEDGANALETKNASQKYNWQNKVILVNTAKKDQYVKFKNALSKTNVNIIWAKSEKETLEECKKNLNIDIVLTGLSFIEEKGYDISTAIKKFRKELPVIGLLNEEEKKQKVQDFETNYDSIILHPFKEKPFFELLEQYIHAV